jgi:hypothetical protein
MGTNDVLLQLIRELGNACGFSLALVEQSVTSDDGYTSATARSRGCAAAAQQVRMDILAKIFVTPTEADAPDTWALVFFYVNGARVSPAGVSHMKLKLERGLDGVLRWVASGWEADVYDEWTELGLLEEHS